MKRILAVCGVLLLAGVARAAGGLSLLENVDGTDNTEITSAAEGMRVAARDKADLATVTSPAEFKTPLVITATAKVDASNIRLYYGDKGVVILNWEQNAAELRHHDPQTGEQKGIPDKGAVARNAFVTIRWTIEEKQSRVEVDGTTRAAILGDYAGLSGTVGIGTAGKSTLTVRSLQVASADPAAQPGLKVTDARWGAPGNTRDVTEKVQGLVKDNSRLNFTVEVATLGDPETQSSTRALALACTVNGLAMSQRFAPGAKVNIVAPSMPAPVATTQGLPTMAEIKQLVDEKKYQDALAKITKVISLNGPAAAPYDHFMLVMYRVDCLLGTHDQSNAMATLSTARKEAKPGPQTSELLALTELLQKSPKGTYTGKADKKVYELLPRESRKEAYKALWTDDNAILQTVVKAAVSGSQLPPLVQVAQQMPGVRAVEFMATDKTDASDKAIKQLKDRAKILLDTAVKGYANTVQQASMNANRLVRQTLVGVGEVTKRAGLSNDEIQMLMIVEADCDRVLAATQDMAQGFGDPQAFNDIATQAAQIKARSNKVRMTSY